MAQTSQQNRDNSLVDASMDDQELLPDEVIFEIISRLPVETIVRCKCVCKKWLNLDSESYFINLHLSRSPGVPLISHFFFLDYGENTTLEFWNWEEVNKRLIYFNLNIAKDLLRKKLELVGSVNGLICLWDFPFNRTYICNPMISKEYMILPKHHIRAVFRSEVSYGFGVSMSGKYKVVRMFSRKTCGLKNPIKVEVYTLGTDEWRTLNDQVSSGKVKYRLFFNGHVHYSRKNNHGLYFNGHLHWILADHQLYTFDLDNETFQLFLSPPVQSETRSIHQFLGVLKGCLARTYISSNEISIWAMKEHGVKTSWHKELVIKENIFGIEPNMWDPLCLVDGCDGKTILVVHARDEGKLFGYCHETDTVEETKRNHVSCVTAMTYRPSFLTLHNFQ